MDGSTEIACQTTGQAGIEECQHGGALGTLVKVGPGFVEHEI